MYTVKINRSAVHKKTAGINLCAVIKYFKIKKKNLKGEKVIFTIKKVLKN